MFKNGDIVKVITRHPDGSTENVYGQIGVITRIEHFATRPNEPDYTVSTRYSDYIYGECQIIEAKPAELRAELRKILTGGKL